MAAHHTRKIILNYLNWIEVNVFDTWDDEWKQMIIKRSSPKNCRLPNKLSMHARILGSSHDMMFVFLPSKHNTFLRHLYNVGPTSSTLVQHCPNVIQMFSVYTYIQSAWTIGCLASRSGTMWDSGAVIGSWANTGASSSVSCCRSSDMVSAS